METVPAPSPTPPAPPPTPPVDVDAVRQQVGEAITKAYAAIRSRDFATAQRELAAVADSASDDQQASDRLQRWRQFLLYAEGYPEYRTRALASAAATTPSYDHEGRQIGVVELNEQQFAYRDSKNPGRTLRVPSDAIPPDIERIIVASWFTADGRAANHLYLGAAALSRRDPDIATARRDWQAAADGGEAHGRLLLELLDDPLITGR